MTDFPHFIGTIGKQPIAAIAEKAAKRAARCMAETLCITVTPEHGVWLEQPEQTIPEEIAVTIRPSEPWVSVAANIERNLLWFHVQSKAA